MSSIGSFGFLLRFSSRGLSNFFWCFIFVECACFLPCSSIKSNANFLSSGLKQFNLSLCFSDCKVSDLFKLLVLFTRSLTRACSALCQIFIARGDRTGRVIRRPFGIIPWFWHLIRKVSWQPTFTNFSTVLLSVSTSHTLAGPKRLGHL